MKPPIILHAPYQRGQDWVLEAEIRPPGIRLAAWISPESVAWIDRQLKRNSSWILRMLAQAKQQLGFYVGLVGVWGRFGVLGELATSIAYKMASQPELARGVQLVDGAQLYLAHRGEHGLGAQEAAAGYVENIMMGAAEGPSQAIQIEAMLTLLAIGDEVLHQPDAYSTIMRAEKLAAQGDEQATLLLTAVRALGQASMPQNDVLVSYDAESYFGEPEQARSMFGYVKTERLLRSIKPTLSHIDVGRVMSTILQTSGVQAPGGLVGMERGSDPEMPSPVSGYGAPGSQVGMERGSDPERPSPVFKGMPYYSAPYDAGVQRSQIDSGWVNPDTTSNFRGGR